LLKIGAILLLVGLAILSPLDDIFLYAIMVPVVGLWVIPFMVGLGLVLTIVGATLAGVHLWPLLKNPVFFVMFIIALAIFVYCVFEYELLACFMAS